MNNTSFKLSLIAMLFIFLYSGCINPKKENGEPIARVYDKYLYISEVEDIFPENISPEDSIQLLMAYTDRWVKKQLLLNRAEKNLSEGQKNVSTQIEDYRSSLLIFKYEQEYIRQRLDTIVSDEEVELFYNENASNFILNESIVKALFIKIRLDDSYYEKIKSLYKSNKEEDIKTLDNLAYQVAIKYDFFNDKWIPFSRILRELPEPLSNPERYLLYNKNIEMDDGTHAYLISFRETMHLGQQAPIGFEKKNIQSIIINKRKQRLITNLESKIYTDAKNHNHFNILVN
ncbi:MAG TPA: hypothetical protein DG754_09850 [Bacteroidales bacterium]|jgi:hypothetical protein|nr:hypothetical protein [Bacteroidales bacterium]